MNAKQRRMRVNKRTHLFLCFKDVERMVCKKPKFKSKKQKQYSKIRVNHFSKKMKEYFAKNPVDMFKFGEE